MPTPYWVQLEQAPSGSKTMCTQIDFTKVTRVTVLRENDVPHKLFLTYEGEKVVFEGPDVKSFLQYWNEYASMERKDEAAKPGLIQVTTGSNSIEGLN